MADDAPILIDEPAPYVRRITLNNPDRRNAISNAMRGALIECLQEADGNDDVRVSIVRGAGPCFSSGYDLKSDLGADQPYFTSNVGLQWAKHATEGWLKLWDLRKPVIAQVHGYAFAGGLELVGACDLAYAAKDARMSHPVLQVAGLPDFGWFPIHMSPRAAMELHLTGRIFDGAEAVEAGLICQAFEPDELEERVLEIAVRITQTPPAVVTVNKRYVYTALEARGARNVIRTGGDLQAGPHLQSLTADDITASVKAKNKG